MTPIGSTSSGISSSCLRSGTECTPRKPAARPSSTAASRISIIDAPASTHQKVVVGHHHERLSLGETGAGCAPSCFDDAFDRRPVDGLVGVVAHHPALPEDLAEFHEVSPQCSGCW